MLWSWQWISITLFPSRSLVESLCSEDSDSENIKDICESRASMSLVESLYSKESDSENVADFCDRGKCSPGLVQ